MPIRDITTIQIAEGRFRREFPDTAKEALINSILSKGNLHPPVVDKDGWLLAGERRLRAIREIGQRGLDYHCNGKWLRPGLIYTTDVRELNQLERLEAEYEENVVRLDLSWQEKAQAVEALHRLRDEQKRATAPYLPLPPDPVAPLPELQTARETAAEIKGKILEEVTRADERDIKADLMVAAWLVEEDEEVSKAPSRKDALRIIERKLEDLHRLELAKRFLARTTDGHHILKKLDLLKALPDTPDNIYDCIVADPPWGVGADTWEQQASTRRHSYQDDMHLAEKIYQCLAVDGYRISKPKAHIYVLCSFGNFSKLLSLFRMAGWDVWPRPLIWVRPNSGVAPRPEHGPRLTYECILFGNKGDKRTIIFAEDVLIHPQPSMNQRAAEKPPGLYYDLLRRSCVPGDEVLDPCCGTGPIYPAATALKIRATGYDIEDDAIGIASQRLQSTYDPRTPGLKVAANG